MAAQEFDKKICDRCFALVEAGAASCPECGAPLQKGAEGTDAAVYPELARANLLRMRGEYKAAAEQCLSILKRYPNNVSAHTLMGDVYSDQGELESSVQWYELALDLDPSSNVDRQKLEAVRSRMRDREAASAAEELGIPSAAPNVPLIAAVAVVLLLVIGFGSFLLGKRALAQREPVVNKPFTATSPASDGKSAITAPKTAEFDQQVPAPAPALNAPQEDRTLAQLISQRSEVGSHLVSVQQDPRSKVLFITYATAPSEDVRKIGAQLAQTAFAQVPDAMVVTVRGTVGERLAFVADVHRERMAEVETEEWRSQNAANPDAWLGHVLGNPWTPPLAEGSTSGTGATFSPPGSTNAGT